MIAAEPQAPSPSAREKLEIFAICAGLVALVLLAFSGTLHNGFVNLDDSIYVYANRHVTHGFTREGIVWAFTSFRPAGFWLPLTWLSYMLDSQIYGSYAGGYHLTNVLLHAGTVVLLFLVLRSMTGFLWRSAFVAAVFAVHPLRVESVAWVAERKDVLSGFFFMLTLLTYARYVKGVDGNQPRKWGQSYGWILFFSVLGLMAKDMLVTLPFVLLLLDYWPLQRFDFRSPPSVFRRLVVEKIPLFGLVMAASVLTYFTQKIEGAVAEKPFGLRIENALVSHGTYIVKMFWPEHLAAFYPYPDHFPAWVVVVSGSFLLAGTVVTIVLGRRFPWLFFGWFWHLGMLLPVIGIIQVGGQAMADRFSYLPQIGLYVALVWGISELAKAWRIPCIVPGMAAGIIVMVLMACSFHQIGYWRDSGSFWTHTLAITPPNAFAHINFGLALEEADRRSEAIEQYQMAVKADPDFVAAWDYLGQALFKEGHFDEAINCASNAIRMKSDDPPAYSILAAALAGQGRRLEATEAYRKAAALQPDNPQAIFVLAKELAVQKKFSEAISFYKSALRLQPNYAEAHNNLADALAAQGQFEEAIGHYQKAIQIRPDYIIAHYNFAVVLAAHARLEEAAEQFRTVIQLDPKNPNAHGNLANVLMAQGKLDEAIAQYQQTIRLSPGSSQAYYRLAMALEKNGQVAGAIIQYQSVLALQPGFAPAQTRLDHIAWVLATSPDPSLRNGPKALELALQIDRLTGGDDENAAATLAAADAEAGKFAEAITNVQRAIQLASSQTNPTLTAALQAQLQCYQAGSPFRDSGAAR